MAAVKIYKHSKTSNLKQNEAQSAYTEPTNKGVNKHWKCVIQILQQRPESPTLTLTWHACKYKGHKLHQIERMRIRGCTSGGVLYLVFARMPGES